MIQKKSTEICVHLFFSMAFNIKRDIFSAGSGIVNIKNIFSSIAYCRL